MKLAELIRNYAKINTQLKKEPDNKKLKEERRKLANKIEKITGYKVVK